MQRLFDAFARAGKELYLVGGAVRDIALGRRIEDLEDLDFCTNARPEESLEILRHSRIPSYDVGKEFGTVGAVLQGQAKAGYPKDCQITTYRSAEYYRRGSRHPEVRFGDTIDQDLRRRDFSINSMAMDAHGHFIDPYGGREDLAQGRLRVVSDPWETLAEDPLRILRIGRFISRLGFAPDEPLRQAATDRAECILDISRERWLQEMNKLLEGAHASKALEFLHEVRILGIVLPELDLLHRLPLGGKGASPSVGDGAGVDLWARTMEVLGRAPRQPALLWAALLHATGEAWTQAPAPGTPRERAAQLSAMLFEGIARRFTFDNNTAKQTRFVLEHHPRVQHFAPGYSDAEVRRLVRALDPWVDGCLDLTQALGWQPENLEVLRGRIQALHAQGELRPEPVAGLGKALQQSFGLEPSPLVGELKSAIEDAIIDGTLENRREPAYYVTHLRMHPPEALQQVLTRRTPPGSG